MIDLFIYITITAIAIPTIVYFSVKWGVVAWFKGKEFIHKEQMRSDSQDWINEEMDKDYHNQ